MHACHRKNNCERPVAALQVKQFEKENERLPAVVYISGTDSSISLLRLVAFTGTRFLRSAAADACIKFGSEETAQMQLLFSVFANGMDLPERLSLEELAQLLRACHFALAEPLLDCFEAYLAPGFAVLDVHEVRAFSELCGACLYGSTVACWTHCASLCYLPALIFAVPLPLPWFARPPPVRLEHCTSLCYLPAASLCCFPARTHRAGQAEMPRVCCEHRHRGRCGPGDTDTEAGVRPCWP